MIPVRARLFYLPVAQLPRCAHFCVCVRLLSLWCCPLVAVRVPSLRIRKESTTMRRELCAWKWFELDHRRGQQHVPVCSCDCHVDSFLEKPLSDSDTQLFESEFIGLIDPILPVRPQKNCCGTLGAWGIAGQEEGRHQIWHIICFINLDDSHAFSQAAVVGLVSFPTLLSRTPSLPSPRPTTCLSRLLLLLSPPF